RGTGRSVSTGAPEDQFTLTGGPARQQNSRAAATLLCSPSLGGGANVLTLSGTPSARATASSSLLSPLRRRLTFTPRSRPKWLWRRSSRRTSCCVGQSAPFSEAPVQADCLEDSPAAALVLSVQ